MNLERLATRLSYVWAAALCVVVCCTCVLATFPQEPEPWGAALWVGIAASWVALVDGIAVRRRLGKTQRKLAAH
jgi:hypothetical protein